MPVAPAQAAVSVDATGDMSGAVDMSDIMGAPADADTDAMANAPVDNAIADAATTPTPDNIGNDASGMIDLSELANMSEEDLAAEANGTPNDNLEGVEDLADDEAVPEQPATLSEEEIAAKEAAHRAESEASLAEASASMQNLHQNIMPEKKKEEKIEVSISSKARKKIKLSLKAKILLVLAVIVLGAGGTLAYLITSGYFNYKSYEVGEFTIRVDESQFESEKDGNKLKVKSKEGGLEFTLADLGQINHADLLEDTAGMNRLFADIDMKVESSTERTLSTAQCAVYKTYHKTKKYSAFIAFCNVGDYMIQIDATSDENGAKAERALVKAGEVVSAAKHK